MSRLRQWATPNTIVLLAAVAVGGTLRVAGTVWGLPFSLHPDEWVVVDGAMDLARRNSFEPTLFLRPDHVEIKLSFLAYTAYAIGILRMPVETAYAADPAVFLHISRLITAMIGTTMIVIAYLIGRRFARPIGTIAAVIVAVFPPFVIHSAYATPDIPLALATMLVMLGCLHYLARPGYASLLFASAFVSVSIAIKYPGAISAVMIAIVVIVAAIRERRLWRILAHGAAAVAAVIGFLFIISPVLFTNIRGVVTAIRKEARTEHAGADGLGFGGNLLFYVNEFATSSGILLSLLALVGIAFVMRRRDVRGIPLALGFITWLALSALALHWERWGIPMFLSPIFFAAIGSYWAYRWLGQVRPAWRWRRPVAGAVVGVVLLNLLAGSVAATVRLRAPDTRVALMDEVAEIGATRANSVFDGYTPLTPDSRYRLEEQLALVDGELVPVSDSVEFAVLSSCNYSRYYTSPKYEDERALYAAIREQYNLLLEVDATPKQRSSVLEPLSIVSALQEIAAIARGGFTGCDIAVYRIPG